MIAFSALLSKIIVGTVAVLGTVRCGFGLYGWRIAETLEKPVYTVIQRLPGGVELRQYEPYLIAETTVDGVGFREPTSSGFRACAGYIFGKNKPGKGMVDGEKMAMTAPVRVSGRSPPAGEKMAMTAPVRVNGGGKKKTKVSFVIGSKYTIKSVPKPVDRNVSIKQVPRHVLATKKFSGPPPSDDRVETERRKIEDSLEAAGLKSADDETLVYGYHDPFITPNFLRRNEVAVYVDAKSVAALQ